MSLDEDANAPNRNGIVKNSPKSVPLMINNFLSANDGFISLIIFYPGNKLNGRFFAMTN
jgi:hypothetical protein